MGHPTDVYRFRCHYCAEEFVTRDYRKRYCDAKCRQQAYRERLLGEGMCAYCGEVPTTRDHVYPRAERARHPDWPMSRYGNLPDTVPCCRQCNSLAGDQVYESVRAKREAIQDRIEIKYRAELAFPEWTPEELEEMGWTLRKDIERRQMLKAVVERRLTFEGLPELEEWMAPMARP